MTLTQEMRILLGSWGLTREQVVQALAAIHIELPARLDSLPQHPAPSPTWVFNFSLPVEGHSGRVHLCTLWVVLEERETYLYITHADHRIDDDFDEEEKDEGDRNGNG
jgi:hypothetical protein